MNIPVDVYVRRIAVGSIIKFADQSQGATWQLVNIEEAVDRTVMEFDLTYPLRDYSGNKVQRVELTIKACELD